MTIIVWTGTKVNYIELHRSKDTFLSYYGWLGNSTDFHYVSYYEDYLDMEKRVKL